MCEVERTYYKTLYNHPNLHCSTQHTIPTGSTCLHLLVPLCVSDLVLQAADIGPQRGQVLLLAHHLHHHTQLLLQTVTLTTQVVHLLHRNDSTKSYTEDVSLETVN